MQNLTAASMVWRTCAYANGTLYAKVNTELKAFPVPFGAIFLGEVYASDFDKSL
jgi:hypothetical protein